MIVYDVEFVYNRVTCVGRLLSCRFQFFIVRTGDVFRMAVRRNNDIKGWHKGLSPCIRQVENAVHEEARLMALRACLLAEK